MVLALMMFTLPLDSKAGFFEDGIYQHLKIIQAGFPTWNGKATTNVAQGSYEVWMYVTPGPYTISPFVGFGGLELTDYSTIGSSGTTVIVAHVDSGPMTFTCGMMLSPRGVPTNLCGQVTLRIKVKSLATGQVIEDETVYLTLFPELNIGSFGGNNLLGCQLNQIRLIDESNGPSLWSLSCPPIVEVSVRECTYNAMTLDYTLLPATTVTRNLTSAELLNLASTGVSYY